MAKTESTAVNQLIQLVQTATPLKPDPTEDLMFKQPAKTKVNPPRVAQTTIPPLRGAGEVSPLPRTRAPRGTQRGVPVINGDKSPAKPAVRLSTASPAQSVAIPSIRPWTSAEGTAETEALPEDARPTPQLDPRATRPSLPPDPRATRPSLPPPTRQSTPPAPPARASVPRMTAVRTEAPPTTPIAAPFETPHGYPSAAPYLAHAQPDMTSHQAWFDQSGGFVQPPVEVEIDMGTAPVRKTTDWKALIPKLIAPTLGLAILGIFVGGYFAFDGEGGKKSGTTVTAPAPAAADVKAPAIAEPTPKVEAPKAEPQAKVEEPKAAVEEPKKIEEPKKVEEPKAKVVEPAPQVAPAATAPVAGRPTFVDVRINSEPQGATVMLVDRGKTMFLGTTPINTALDPSRQYDLVFTYTNKPTVIEHIDPSTTKKLTAILGGKKAVEAPKAVKTEAPKAVKAEAPKAVKAEAPKVDVKKEAPKAEPKKEAPKVVGEPAETKPPVETKPPAAPAGDGVLMISSKPPCEIFIDGAPTGLTTPQRALKLPIGKHKITLVNAAEKIRKTIPVTITADQPTKLIENFMK